MPVRLRITLLFTIAAIIILGIVCGGIYYFSSQSRLEFIKTRLTNRAITTARFLQQSDYFSQDLIRRIDSSTTQALKRKSVQAYRGDGARVYHYTETPGDTVAIGSGLLQKALDKGTIYFTGNMKEAVAYASKENNETLIVVCAAVDEDGLKSMQQLRKILIFCFIAGILISFAGGYLFSTQLMRPVSTIANEVKEISAHNLEQRIATGNSSDEWNHLATTLNELLDRLKESFEMQRRFISNASHELSTPLTLVSSQLEISLQRHRTEEEYRLAMQKALQDVRNMSSLLQTLLKFASASGNPGGLNIDLLRIDEILMRLPAEIQKGGKDQRVSLTFSQLPEDENLLLVLGNEELLFTAIRNIVSNACKYSDDHHAEVSLEITGKSFIIKVIDKGPGIAEKEIASIFQPFYRVDDTRSVSGFGLGLSLASRIIKLHKGTINVKSELGVGSVFSIELPAAR